MKTGIEAAMYGFAAKHIEMRTSKAGNPWGTLNVGVESGATTDDGSAALEWVKVSLFGSTAEALAPRIEKGTKLYLEGWLKVDRYKTPEGEHRVSIALAANKCEITGIAAIGKNRPRQSRDDTPEKQPTPRHVVNAITGVGRLPAFTDPPPEPRKIVGRDDFNDRMDYIPYLDR
jgi:single-strand DNA-binding protein